MEQMISNLLLALMLTCFVISVWKSVASFKRWFVFQKRIRLAESVTEVVDLTLEFEISKMEYEERFDKYWNFATIGLVLINILWRP